MRITTLEHLIDETAGSTVGPTADTAGTAADIDAEAGLGALGTERGNLPLETIDVRSRVTGLAVLTELAQGFHNPYDVPLEATYIFPLPDRAAVTRLRMEVAGRVVEGDLSRSAGRRAPSTTRRSRPATAPAIAEEERPGVFTLRVGNLMPGERAVVRLTLSGRLPFEDGEVTFRFPLVVAPRYIPGAALPGEQVGTARPPTPTPCPTPRGSRPPVLLPGFPNPVRLRLEVDVDAGRPAADGDPVQPARRRVQERQDGGSWSACGRASGSTAISSCASPTGRRRRHTLAGRWPATRRGRGEGTFLLTVRRRPSGGRGAAAARRGVRAGPLRQHGRLEDGGGPPRVGPHGRHADRRRPVRGARLRQRRRDAAERARRRAWSEATDRNRFRAVEYLASRRGARRHRDGRAARQRPCALLTGGRRLPRARAGAGHRRPGRQRGPDPGAARRRGWAACACSRSASTGPSTPASCAGWPTRRRAVRAGGVRGPPRRGDGAIHRRIGTPVVIGLAVRRARAGHRADSVGPARLPDLFAGAPLVVTRPVHRRRRPAPSSSPARPRRTAGRRPSRRLPKRRGGPGYVLGARPHARPGGPLHRRRGDEASWSGRSSRRRCGSACCRGSPRSSRWTGLPW